MKRAGRRNRRAGEITFRKIKSPPNYLPHALRQFLRRANQDIHAELGEVDGRTDVYALGATLYELLTLRSPLVGQNRDQVTSQITAGEPLPPRARNRQVPINLNSISLKALEKQPSRRYQSAGEMADDLRRFAEDQPVKTRAAGRVSH